MKSTLLTLLFGIVTCSLTAQTNIYVSNSGTNIGINLPTISNPAKTLEDALTYIKGNLVNSNNQATTPINVYLMASGGDILFSYAPNLLIWDVSGTSSNPVTITSLNDRATLSRADDDGLMLHFKDADYIKIRYIDFKRVTSGAIQLDNCDNNEIKYCSFHGDGGNAPTVDSGVIWIGVNKENGYEGENS